MDLFIALLVVLVLSFLTIYYYSQKFPYETTLIVGGIELSGAYRYERINYDNLEIVSSLKYSIAEDGYEFVGSIENNLLSEIDVYIKKKYIKYGTVILIQTEVFTMDILLEHRALIKEYIKHYLGEDARTIEREVDGIRTIIVVNEMSISLQLLLCTRNIDGIIDEKKVYALVLNEKRLYTRKQKLAYKTEMLHFEKNLIEPLDQRPEYIWKGLKWSDLLFLDWSNWTFHGANQCITFAQDAREYKSVMKQRLIDNRYEYVGEIRNNVDAIIETYVFKNNKENPAEVVIFIESAVFTKDIFHQHRYLISEFLKGYFEETDYQWQYTTRIVVICKEMSTPLKILISMYSLHPSKRLAFVCAFVENEKRIYSMNSINDEFFEAHLPWINQYLPEINHQELEYVWQGTDWKKLDGLPFTKEEMFTVVHKSLNIIGGF